MTQHSIISCRAYRCLSIKLIFFNRSAMEDEATRSSSSENQPELFPSPKTMLMPETWTQILSHLPPKDALTAMNTCPEWAELMKGKVSSLLFPLVVPILEKYLHRTEETLIKFRVMGHHIKEAADKLLEPDETHFYDGVFHGYLLDGVDEMESFNRRMEERPFPLQNPFISPSIVVVFSSGEQVDEDARTKSVAYLFFSRYGAHLHKIILYADATQLDTVFTQLVHLPNLQSLELDCDTDESDLEWLNSACIPPLDNLKFFRLVGIGTQGAPSSNEVIGIRLLNLCGANFRRLAIAGNCLREAFHAAVTSTLNTKLAGVHALEIESADKYAIKIVKEITWPSEELNFSRREGFEADGDGGGSATVVDLAEAASNFSLTLVHLKIFPEDQSDDDEFSWNTLLAFPKLKKLELDYCNVKRSWFWKFLESCQSLEELCLESQSPEKIPEDDVLLTKRAFDVMATLRKIVVRSESRQWKTVTILRSP